MNKSIKSSIFKTSLLVALLGSAFGSQAAGLGKLTVYSAIGQPLNAEVTLNATPEELHSLSARLASADAFRDAGVDFMPALSGLRFSIAKSASGQPLLRLATDRPLNEPFLHFLVELNWTAGRMVREYTFLLDPPEMLQAAKPAAVVAPAMPAAATPAAKPLAAQKVDAQPVSPRRPAAQPAGEVKVKPGDTLSKIAREYKSETVSLDQMLVALFNTNRDVFDDSNMNRLRAGKILKLPDPAEVAQVNPGEARKMIISQAADFNAYKRRLAQAAGAAPAVSQEPQQQAAGKIKPQIEEKTPPAPVADKLEVSRTEAAKGGMGKGKLEEELIARDKALREASERIVQLEKNLQNLKQLTELKSQAGAQMQQQAQTAAPAATPAPVPAAPAEKPVEPPAAKPAEVPVGADKPADAQPEAAKSTETAATAAPAARPSEVPKPAVKRPVPPPPPEPEPDFIEDNPEIVFGGGGLIALLLGYFGYSAWRRKKQAGEAADLAGPSVPHAPRALASAEAEKAKVDEKPSVMAEAATGEDDSILGDFSETGMLTSEEGVDPVAEADVLMAYGRDVQAEEILLEGLKADPTRTAIHAKLLELYANRKDAERFTSVAQDMHTLNKGEGAEWSKAEHLARTIGISGGLFGAASPSMMEAAPVAVEHAEPVSVAEEAPVEAPAVETSEPVQAPAPAVAEADSLDFDLDLGTTSVPAAVAAAEKVSAPPADEGAMGMDFDFDLGAPSEPAVEPQPAAEAAGGSEVDLALDMETTPAPESDSNEISFDLDLGTSEPAAEAAAAVPEAGATDEVPAALDLSDISLDLDVPQEMAATEPSPAVAEPAAMDIDLGGADDGVSGEASAAAPAASEGAASAEVDNPEAATKLELAQAYKEMGDKDGARELLNEVLGEGSPNQQAQAKAQLDLLDA